MGVFNTGFQGKTIWILLYIFIFFSPSRNRVSCSLRLKELKASEKTKLVHIGYILKPNESVIDIMCLSHSKASLKITCPVFDDGNSSFDIATNHDARKSTNDNKTNRNVCSVITRKVAWSQAKNISSFVCLCWARQEVSMDFERKASVEITIHTKKRRTSTVFRRKIKKGKHIHLTCCITGHPRPKITWYKNNHPLSINKSAAINNVTYEQKGRSLVISRSDISISGCYQCLGQNFFGEARGEKYRVELYVTKPKIINQPVQPRESNHYSFQEYVKRENKSDENGEPTKQQQKKTGNPYFKKFITKAHETNDDVENEEGQNKRKNGLGTIKMIGMIIGVAVFVSLAVLVLFIFRHNFLLKCQCTPSMLTETTETTETTEYRNSTTRTECTIVFEEDAPAFSRLFVDTLNSDGINDYHKQDSPSQDSMQSNTSALFNELNRIPPNADPRYFTSLLVNHHGGEVILHDTGIKLVIPEGAIDVGKTEVISLALPKEKLDNNNDFMPPKIINNGTLLTPIVICGPHGFHFKKNVLLILPHCLVVDDEVETNFRVHCSDTRPGIPPEWKEIFNTSLAQSKEVFCHMGKQHFSLFVQHFSWYFIEGEGNAKNFSVAAYHTSFHQPDEAFKVRIYLIPNMEGSSVSEKKVQECENSLQGTLCDGLKLKIFHQDGGNLKIEAIEINDGWKLFGRKTQFESYKQLCCCKDGSPNRTFLFEHEKDHRPDRIFCMFRISQEKCEFDAPVEIAVSEHFQSAIKRARIRGSLTSTSSSGLGSGESGAKVFFPIGLRKDLIQLLDIEIVGKEDYRELANRLGYKTQFIRWLECQHRQSPTDLLLMQWENDHQDQSEESALRKLHAILLEMRREDAAVKIQEYFDGFQTNEETERRLSAWV
ncbi:uncharacterized protein LOC114533340 isoform X2 [Dendronephthya gigantea]|uniref:uncharacterized protein LOC114533340 isoform X2 n=1 Tax=Dendronephthya gigantea TaxID=151771 RepID=UPI00106C6BCA|nr:uncharacterized protein LOC114533340 isoform X2 [Dendronephthya gigantea]